MVLKKIAIVINNFNISMLKKLGYKISSNGIQKIEQKYALFKSFLGILTLVFTILILSFYTLEGPSFFLALLYILTTAYKTFILRLNKNRIEEKNANQRITATYKINSPYRFLYNVFCVVLCIISIMMVFSCIVGEIPNFIVREEHMHIGIIWISFVMAFLLDLLEGTTILYNAKVV